MTPELRQAITILQMSSLELTNFLEEQIMENPLLEVREDEGERAEGPEGTEIKSVEEPVKTESDMDWLEYFQDSSDLGLDRSPKQAEKLEYTYENFVSQAPTLVEHLSVQLALSPAAGEVKRIVEYLIGNLDERGYLTMSLEDVVKQLKITPEQAQLALEVLQSFEPTGVGARDLKECLLIQMKFLGIDDQVLEHIITDHLKDLADGRLNRIAAKLAVPVQEVQRAADVLKTLEPKPGRNFSHSDELRYIVPDVVVEKVSGQYIILVNDVNTPRLTINKTYRSILNKENRSDTETKQFVESKLNAAAWLIKSIEQRRLTLYKVANCLVEVQRDFLDLGVKYLKPLNLKRVAEQVGLHESTVSRATSNKYIQTPQGVFEMKYFFSTGLQHQTGNQVSSESIKKILQEIISSEDSKNPLSDQKIADLFGERGIKVSRRTVTKYRDELAIPSTNKRKRY